MAGPSTRRTRAAGEGDTDAVTVLARLLAEPALRARFRADREHTLGALGVAAAERALLVTLDAEGLERQARALVGKRRSEVAGLLPRTFARGGAALRADFERYATGFWPRGHRRHLEDALAFALRLRRRRDPALRGDELNRLRFRLGRRRLALHWVGSLRHLRDDAPGLQLLLRRRDEAVSELRLRLAG